MAAWASSNSCAEPKVVCLSTEQKAAMARGSVIQYTNIGCTSIPKKGSFSMATGRIGSTPNMTGGDPFELRKPGAPTSESESNLHVDGDGFICDTDGRGYAAPNNRT